MPKSLSTARQFGTLIGLVVLSAVLWALTPHFLTIPNLVNVAQQTSINAVVAVGILPASGWAVSAVAAPKGQAPAPRGP